ncbi:hypothetical protein DL96DRAFT_1812738 [Flagelloscypha sp. PMI_526]|nr:hypothetical protein DL96DRAFT_1812738 [Flagelloscypha sp. PMI_526]
MSLALIFSQDLDAARRIIEFAAEDGTVKYKTARALSLVSKQVQKWADPAIFRDILITDFQTLRNCRLVMDAVINSSSGERFEHVRHCIKTFTCMHVSDPEGRIARFLERCPNIFSIALWGLPFPGLLLSTKACYPSFRMACFEAMDYGSHTAGNSVRQVPLLRLPPFQNLTHLDWSSWSFTDWSKELWTGAGLGTVPSLTHLVLSANDQDEERRPLYKLTDIFQVLQECKLPPNLKVLLLIVAGGHMRSLEEGMTVQYDSRIALAIQATYQNCPDELLKFDRD